jgi:hypothetical protein
MLSSSSFSDRIVSLKFPGWLIPTLCKFPYIDIEFLCWDFYINLWINDMTFSDAATDTQLMMQMSGFGFDPTRVKF